MGKITKFEDMFDRLINPVLAPKDKLKSFADLCLRELSEEHPLLVPLTLRYPEDKQKQLERITNLTGSYGFPGLPYEEYWDYLANPKDFDTCSLPFRKGQLVFTHKSNKFSYIIEDVDYLGGIRNYKVKKVYNPYTFHQGWISEPELLRLQQPPTEVSYSTE